MILDAESSAVLSWLLGESDGETVRRSLADAEVVAALGEAAIEEKFDMGYHTRHVDTIFERVFGES